MFLDKSLVSLFLFFNTDNCVQNDRHVPYGQSTSTQGQKGARESPKRSLISRQQKSKPMSPDEWLRKLETESATYNDEDEDENGPSFQRGMSGKRKSGRRKPATREEMNSQGFIFE